MSDPVPTHQRDALLIGRAELGRLLGCSRAQTYTLEDRHADFPSRLDIEGAAKWRRSDVIEWIESLPVKTRGAA